MANCVGYCFGWNPTIRAKFIGFNRWSAVIEGTANTQNKSAWNEGSQSQIDYYYVEALCSLVCICWWPCMQAIIPTQWMCVHSIVQSIFNQLFFCFKIAEDFITWYSLCYVMRGAEGVINSIVLFCGFAMNRNVYKCLCGICDKGCYRCCVQRTINTLLTRLNWTTNNFNSTTTEKHGIKYSCSNQLLHYKFGHLRA